MLSGKSERRLDVLWAQCRKIVEDFLLGRSACEVFQDVIDT